MTNITVGYNALLGSDKVRARAAREHTRCVAMIARVRTRQGAAAGMLLGPYTFGPRMWMRVIMALDPAERARYARRWPKRRTRMAGK